MTSTIHFGEIRVAPHVRDGMPTGKWLIDIPKSLAGKRRRRFFDNCEEAKEAAVLLNRELNGNGRGIGPGRVFDGQRPLLLDDAIRQWLKEQRRRVELKKKRQNSLDTDLTRLRHAQSYFGNVRLDQINGSWLEEFQLMRLKAGLKPSSINSDVRTIKKVLNWAYREGLLERPVYVDEVPVERKRKIVPSKAEVQRIIENARREVRPIIRMLAETGCRRGEILNLSWEDVDLESRTISIQSKEGWTPKTRHSERIVRISEGLAQEVGSLPRKSQWVFPGPDPAKPRKGLKRAFATAVRRAKIMRNGEPLHIRVHDLRAFCRTYLRDEKNVPGHIVQDHLGHVIGSQVTDKHYLGRTMIDLDQCVIDLDR